MQTFELGEMCLFDFRESQVTGSQPLSVRDIRGILLFSLKSSVINLTYGLLL